MNRSLTEGDIKLISLMINNIVSTYKKANNKKAVMGFLAIHIIGATWNTIKSKETELSNSEEFIDKVNSILETEGLRPAINYLSSKLIEDNEREDQ